MIRYPINSTNNKLYVRLNDTAAGDVFSDHIVTIDQGAPTFSALADELTTKLTGLGPSTITVTWNPAT